MIYKSFLIHFETHTYAQFPECFHPWTFPMNIEDVTFGLLYIMLRFSIRNVQALPLIVFVVFGAVDYPLASCMLVHFLEI